MDQDGSNVSGANANDLYENMKMKYSGENGASDKPKKRIRRTANEINRRFICACGKAYGSEGSLN